MQDLTAFQRDCLYVIGGLGDPSGTAILDKLDNYYESEIHHGRLYPSLDDLVNSGLIEKGKKDDRANEYTLTDDGAQVLEGRREWEGDLSS
mgnify:CR=1 FL=1